MVSMPLLESNNFGLATAKVLTMSLLNVPAANRPYEMEALEAPPKAKHRAGWADGKKKRNFTILTTAVKWSSSIGYWGLPVLPWLIKTLQAWIVVRAYIFNGICTVCLSHYYKESVTHPVFTGLSMYTQSPYTRDNTTYFRLHYSP